ncbi:MAG: GAF domain-containing protein, partial [Balneolaceae bacterium]
MKTIKMSHTTDELKSQIQQQEAELQLIRAVQKSLIENKEMRDIYELVGNRLLELFDSQVTGIYTFDHETGLEHFEYLFEDGERLYPKSRPLNQIRKWLIQKKDVLLINDNADENVFKITGEKHEPIPGTRLPKSLVFVPLVVDENVTGCLSLQNLDREHAFTVSDVRLLNTLTNSMSLALENARLFNETEQRNAELAVINSVQEGLVAEMDMQGIYDLVGDRIRDLFDAQVAAICTFDLEHGIEKYQYLFENGERYYPEPRPLDKLRKRLIKTRKMIWINDNAAEAFTTITGEAPKAVPGTRMPKSMVYVPLIIGDSVRGYVTLQNLDREYAFNDSDVRLLSTLANSMSVALENARLFNETEQRNAELAVINSVQQGLVAEMDMQGIYDLVGDRIRVLFDAQVAAIVTFNLETKTEHFTYLFEDGDRLYPNSRPYDKVREKIIKERKTLLFNENAAQSMSEINGKPFKPVPGTRLAISAVYVPMVVGESVRGYVTLQNLDREQAFSDSDVRLLNTLVNSMSVAL